MKRFFWYGAPAAWKACVEATAGLLLCAAVSAGPAPQALSPGVMPELSNIAYLNKSDYLVEISVVNRSSSPLNLPNCDIRFSAQSEVLGRWIELAWRSKAGRVHPFTLSPGEERRIEAIVTLPEDTPHLYKNHEGDVNLRFQYTFACPGGADAAPPQCSGESAYWLTPGTSQWVLREGM